MVKYLTNLFFVLYFVILFGERVQSIIRSYVNKSYTNDGLTVYMYVLTVVSIVATTVFLLIRQRNMFVGLFTMDEAHHNAIDYEILNAPSKVTITVLPTAEKAKRSCLTTLPPTWQSRYISATLAPPSSATL